MAMNGEGRGLSKGFESTVCTFFSSTFIFNGISIYHQNLLTFKIHIERILTSFAPSLYESIKMFKTHHAKQVPDFTERFLYDILIKSGVAVPRLYHLHLELLTYHVWLVMRRP